MLDHQLPEVSLQDNEWDFSGCPVDELFECWVYEFAREYHRRHGSIPEAWRIWFPFGADFPQTPYLSVSRAAPSKEDVKLVSEWLDKHPEAIVTPPVSIVETKSQPGLCLKIDWQFSDTVLLKWMRLILKEKRPRPPAQGKGRPKEREADLIRLGAFRLVKIANLNISQATEYSASHKKGAIEIPLYADQAEWSKASANVERIMAGFSDEMEKLTP